MGHTVVVKKDGTLWATGFSANNNRKTFEQVMTGVKTVSIGFHHTMVIKQDGTLWATGQNSKGQLGDGSTTNRATFKQVMTGVKDVSAGGYHTTVIKQDGSVWATGENTKGQLGDGTKTNRNTFKKVTPSHNKKCTAIGAGHAHTVAVCDHNRLYVTGDNNRGQLGNGKTSDRNVWGGVEQFGLTSVAAGYYNSAIIKNHHLRITGDNKQGQLGLGRKKMNRKIGNTVYTHEQRYQLIFFDEGTREGF